MENAQEATCPASMVFRQRHKAVQLRGRPPGSPCRGNTTDVGAGDVQARKLLGGGGVSEFLGPGVFSLVRLQFLSDELHRVGCCLAAGGG